MYNNCFCSKDTLRDKTMSGNASEDFAQGDGNLHLLVINGVEYMTRPYTGCSKCSSHKERIVYYEESMRERMEGKKKKYPFRYETLFHSSCVAENLKNFGDQLKITKNIDQPVQNHGKINTDELSLEELEHMIQSLESYTFSLRAKLHMCKAKKGQARGATGEHLNKVIEVSDKEERQTESVKFVDETEPSDESLRMETSDTGSGTRSRANVGTESDNKSTKIKNKATDEGTSGSDTDWSSSEEELHESELFTSSSDEPSAAKKTGEHKHQIQTQIKGQAKGKDVTYISDKKRCDELEIHSTGRGSSSIKGRIRVHKHHFTEPEHKQSEDAGRTAKRRRRALLETVEELTVESEDDSPVACHELVNLEDTESSMFFTAKETISQVSEELHDSSGSATP